MTRPPPEERPTAADSQRQSSGGGGLTCPKCGCRNLKANGTNKFETAGIQRYRVCRNCGTSFLTSQPPEKIVREIGTDSVKIFD